MTQARAVIFDLDGTLYHEGPLRRRMLIELGLGTLRLGLRLPRVIGAWRQEREDLRGERFATGEQLAREHLARAARRSGMSQEQIQSCAHEWLEQRPLRHLSKCARVDLCSTLQALRAGNVRVGVFSDHPVRDKLKALGVDQWVQASCCATSEEVGAFKPDPRGYLYLAQVLGVAPEEVLVVGDRDDADGAGARNAGMQFRLLGPGTESIARLQEVLPLVGLGL